MTSEYERPACLMFHLFSIQKYARQKVPYNCIVLLVRVNIKKNILKEKIFICYFNIILVKKKENLKVK